MLSLPHGMKIQFPSGEVSRRACSIQRCDDVCGSFVGNTLESDGLSVLIPLEGQSVQSSIWAVSVVRETGLRREGSRRKLGAERARQQSFEAAGYLVGEDGARERHSEERHIMTDRDILEQMRSERWSPTKRSKTSPSTI